MNTPHEHAMVLQELVLFRMTSFLYKQTIEQRKIYIHGVVYVYIRLN